MTDIAIEPIQIGLGETQYIFRERLISVAEEQEIDNQLSAILEKDSDRLQKEFEVYRNALIDYAIGMPQRLEKGENSEMIKVPLNGGETPKAAIEEAFGERTLINERVIRGAYSLFRSKQNPTFLFLSPSA